MIPEWSDDFSYSYLRRLFSVIRKKYKVKLFRNISGHLDGHIEGNILVHRHDIDVSLERAIPIASMEHEMKIQSTFMVMINSPFYSLDDPNSRDILNRIQDMGHDIALHYSLSESISREEDPTISSLEDDIHRSIDLLEDRLNIETYSISFHRPLAAFLRGPQYVNGKVNAYSQELMDWYLSDSRGRWREGEPIPQIDNPKKPILQLLIHPIWWGPTHMDPMSRIQNHFASYLNNLSRTESLEFIQIIYEHIGIELKG